MWKGDTADVPSGTSNPEGSVTNPGHDSRVNDSRVDGFGQTPENGGNPNHESNVRASVTALSNNMCAALHEDSDDESMVLDSTSS